MHELSLLADLMRKVEAVAREQGSPRVVAVRVKLGALAHISAEHLRDHFERAARGTLSEGAELIVDAGTDPADPHAQEILLDSVEVAT